MAGEGAYASAMALACNRCRAPGMRALAAPSLAAARKMLGQRLEALLDAHAPAAPDLQAWLFDAIEHHIERKLGTRRMLATAQNALRELDE
jgi:hypothetical protein